MPRRVFLPYWVWAVAVVAVVAEWILTNNNWFFAGLFVLAIGENIYVFYIVRCPTCSGRLTFSKAFIARTTRYRIHLACPQCQIVWDTGTISDDAD